MSMDIVWQSEYVPAGTATASGSKISRRVFDEIIVNDIVDDSRDDFVKVAAWLI